VPVIAKKELDLHKLYVEVTSRGGYDKVVLDKKWREIGYAFNFAPTTTSASFVLRKHYNTLLLHYEQVYFFNSQAPVLSPVRAPLAFEKCFNGADVANNGKHMPQSRVEGGGAFSGSADGGPVGSTVAGVIDGKFDNGYLVSVRIGTEVLHGVLYHPAKHPVTAPAPDPNQDQDQDEDNNLDPEPINAIVPYDPNPRQPGRRRKRRRRWGGDPTHPKPNRSGYNFFFAEKHSMLKSLYPNKREFTKMVGNSWNNLSPEERMVYQKIGLEDKERYKRELDEYKKLKQRHGELNGTSVLPY
ncbi:High mobility group B protein 9-like protein, partial [Drosera capensis]